MNLITKQEKTLCFLVKYNACVYQRQIFRLLIELSWVRSPPCAKTRSAKQRGGTKKRPTARKEPKTKKRPKSAEGTKKRPIFFCPRNRATKQEDKDTAGNKSHTYITPIPSLFFCPRKQPATNPKRAKNRSEKTPQATPGISCGW